MQLDDNEIYSVVDDIGSERPIFRAAWLMDKMFDR